MERCHVSSALVGVGAPIAFIGASYYVLRSIFARNYRVLGSGDIVLRHSIVPHGRMPQWLPKVGLQMVLAEGMETLTWYGRGPHETYPDRKTGARVGIHEGSVTE